MEGRFHKPRASLDDSHSTLQLSIYIPSRVTACFCERHATLAPMDAKHLIQPLVPAVTIPEFMRVTRCAKSTAYRWCRDGTIQSVKIGKKILIPRSAVIKLLTPK